MAYQQEMCEPAGITAISLREALGPYLHEMPVCVLIGG